MNSILIGALMALSAVQQTDTTFAVGTARFLDVDNDGGEVIVTAWERNEIRVRAEHSRRSTIEIDHGRNVIELDADARGGGSGIVEYEITVPRDFGLRIDGMYVDIAIDGVHGDIQAESLQGDIVILGSRGNLEVESTTGKVRIEDAEGRLQIESVSDEIRIVNARGDVVAESVGGNILMQDMRARNVDVGTVGGRITYSGSIESGGLYFFGSHGGSIDLIVPEGSGAEVSLASLHGAVGAQVPGAPQRFERGARTNFQMGEGDAVIEAETFGGRITIRNGRLASDGEVR